MVSDEVTVIVLTALISLFISWIIFIFKRQSKDDLALPPGPRGPPVVGYLPFLGSDPRWAFKALAEIYGPIFKVHLGTKQCIVVSSPSLVKEVLRDQDVVFANRDPTIAGRIATFGAQEVAFSDYGPEWRKVKKVFVNELMSNASLDASYQIRKNQVSKMINKINSKAGEPVDVGELIFVTIMSSIMGMVWGETLKGDEDGVIVAKFRSIAAEFTQLLGAPNISDYLPALAWLDLQGIRRRMKLHADQVEQLFDMAIDQHNAPDENNREMDFLGCLLQRTKDEDPATSLTLPQVKAILVDAVIGGMDTTATTIEWVMAELLQHPEVMRVVQEELTDKIGLSSVVEEAHLPDLKYLNAVVKETLRLHTVVPLLIPHCPSKRTTLGGYTVPKTCQVIINAWAVHRDPQNWRDPLAFQPERFLNGFEKSDFLSMGKQHQYLPFGSGRRMCPGMNLAEKTSMYVLASMLHAFEWTLPNSTPDVDLSETFGIILKKTKSLIAVPSPRLSTLELLAHV